MARKRQARRCRARRTDGRRCRAWAMEYQDVCRAHGGMTQQARHAARARRTEAVILRAFNADYDRWLRELAAWHAQRVTITARLLGIPPGDVQPVDIGCCRGLYGQPEGPETKPQIRHDRRYLANRPADYAARSARW